jgi:soluble lytic murein transglycosylase-like protein
MQIVLLSALMLSAAMPVLAHADIYSFTDAAGVTHFSNVPDDARFQLLVHSPMAEAGKAPTVPAVAARWLAKATTYDAAIERAARASTLKPALVRAIIVVESGFNPHAVSRKGALGLMQLLPATARRYGAFNALDPEQNIAAGTRYLAALLTRFDQDLELALAAYNAGEAAVERYGRRIPPFRETRLYVPNVLQVYRMLGAASEES